MPNLNLREKIAAFSCHPGERVAQRAEVVVVVPLGGDLSAGFARARSIQPRPVRLIGHGVTLPGTWPTWAARSRGLVLTELGAYRTQTGCARSEPIRRALSRWTDAIFDNLGGGVTGSEALYPTAATRLLSETMDTREMAEGIADVHRDTELHVVGRPWDDLEQQLGRRRSRLDKIARRALWPSAFAAAWSVAAAATVWREVQAFRATAPTRAALRSARTTKRRAGKGDVWVCLIPDLLRVNRHVIESIALPALREDRLRGVLLVGSLGAGLRTETRLKTQTSATLWPGLGALLEKLPDLQVDQAVGGEDVRELAGDLVQFAKASTRAAVRIAMTGPSIHETAGCEHDLFRELRNLAALSTIDVARAVSAQRAAHRATARHVFKGSRLVFLSSSAASLASATAVFNHAEATTIDFFHGAGIEHCHGGVESPAHVHATWTKLDAEAFEAMGYEAVEGGMPIRIRPRRVQRSRRVLILSNYAHRDDRWRHLLPFQDELLRIATLAPQGFEIRWRPHPADDPACVQRTLRRVSGVQLSTEAALENDVGWADFVVSSISSALIEALFADVPVFVHFPPHVDGLHVFSYVSPERSFFHADELWPKLLGVKQGIDAGLDCVRLERVARQKLFGGPGGEPLTLDFGRLLRLPTAAQ